MALRVTKLDLDTACAAYHRATGDNPRREGLRVALHSYRQLTDEQRTVIAASCDVLAARGFTHGAQTILEALGLNEPSEPVDESPAYGKLTGGYYGG